MKLVFISNFMNHHQKDFCDSLFEACEEFYFICKGTIPDQTLKFGYDDMTGLPYVIPNQTKTEEWIQTKIEEADVVIFGDSSYQYLESRMKANRLSFILSERMWKKGYYRRWIPYCRKKVTERFTKYKNKNLYVMTSSCYLAKDIEMVGFPAENCFKWGYFTPLDVFDSPGDIYDNKKANSIIWAGRHIPLKHLEDLLVAVSRLKKKGYRFSLSVIGDGQKAEEWQHLSRKLGVENEVLFMGSMPSHSVRNEMKKAQIFVSTSDFNEGWGAVINEGMNSACVPIVSHAMGASAFLIKNGQNGFIYKNGDITSLEKCLTYLFDHSESAKGMAISAYHTIVDEYNGVVAAERLLSVSECLLNGKTIPTYLTGPMSLSPLLKNNWISRNIIE